MQHIPQQLLDCIGKPIAVFDAIFCITGFSQGKNSSFYAHGLENHIPNENEISEWVEISKTNGEIPGCKVSKFKSENIQKIIDETANKKDFGKYEFACILD